MSLQYKWESAEDASHSHIICIKTKTSLLTLTIYHSFYNVNSRRGWCPRKGKGQRLMFKEAVSEYIWLATCQGKIYENKPPSATHETI